MYNFLSFKSFLQCMDLSTSLCILIVLFMLFYFIGTFKITKKYNLPPLVSGGYPIVGHFFDLFYNPHLKLDEWKKKYGNVYRIGFAGKTGIVLTNFASLKETYKIDGMTDKPVELMKFSDDFETLFEYNGKRWADHRKFAVNALRGIKQEQIIQTELSRLLKTLDNTDLTGDLNIHDFICSFTNNVGLNLVCGKSFDLGHPALELILNYNLALQEVFKFRPFAKAVGLPVPLFTTLVPQYRRAEKFIAEMAEFLRKEIKEHKISLDEDNPRDFIDLSLIETSKSSDLKRIKNEIEILGDAQLMLFGGTDTTRVTFEWITLLLAMHPKMQERIYQEISEVFGSSNPKWDSHSRLPFAEAFIKESQRFKTIFPTTNPRLTPMDIKIDGFDVPKGSLIIPSAYSIHMDENDYENPRTFNPDRFMSNQNKTVPDQWVPFSYGNRNCLGDKVARMVLFIFLTGIVQNYFVFPPKAGVNLEHNMLLVMTPKNPQIRLQKRPNLI